MNNMELVLELYEETIMLTAKVEKWRNIADNLYQGYFEMAFDIGTIQEAIEAYEQAKEELE